MFDVETIRLFGYPAIAAGVLLEGETALLLAGLIAKLGTLSLAGVIVAATFGAVLNDWTFFFLGRRYGWKLLDRRPRWRAKADAVSRHLQHHERWLVPALRFMYGCRVAGSYALGASGLAKRRFLWPNLAASLLWAAAYGSLGFLFGHAAEGLLGNLKNYELSIVIALILSGAAVAYLRHRRLARIHQSIMEGKNKDPHLRV